MSYSSQWFFGLREQGIMASARLVVVKTSTLGAQFRRKTARAKEMAVRQLLASNRIVTRAVTHTCQRPPNEVRQEVLDFIHYLHEKLVGENRSTECIINMDQTPVFFDMPVAGHSVRKVLCWFFVTLPPISILLTKAYFSPQEQEPEKAVRQHLRSWHTHTQPYHWLSAPFVGARPCQDSQFCRNSGLVHTSARDCPHWCPQFRGVHRLDGKWRWTCRMWK